MKTGIRRQLLAIAGAVALFVPAPGREALADTPVEAALRSLASGIDQAPGWTAAFRRLSYDAASDTAVMSGLSIAAPAIALTIDFGSISVTGYADADGAFTAKSIKTDDVAVDMGPVKMAVSDVAFNDIGVPPLPGGLFDPEKPLSSMVGIYAKMIQGKVGPSRIGSVSVIEEIKGVNTRLSYENLEFSGMQDGKTATLTAGPVRMQSSAPDGPFDMTMARIEATDMDLAAMVHVYDAAQYGSDGAGDMIWRSVVGHAAYKGIEMRFPQATAALGDISMDGLKARQPKHSFTPLLDKVMAHPELADQAASQAAALEGIVDLMSAFSIGRFGVSGLKVEASGYDPFELGDFHFSDLSIEGLGEMVMEGLAGTIPGTGSVKVGRFAFGGVKFADPEKLRTAIRAASAEGGGADNGAAPFDPTSLVPTLGFLEMAGIDVQAPSVPHISLDEMRVDLTDYVGYLPSNVAAHVTALTLPLDALDASSQEVARGLGYTDGFRVGLVIDGGYGQTSDTLTLRSLSIDAAAVGKLAVDGKLSGVPLAKLMDKTGAMEVLATAKLDGFRLRFDNGGIVEKALDMLAGQAGKQRAEIVTQISETLLGNYPGNGAFRDKLAAALTGFFADPKSITLSAAPAAPVAFAAIITAVSAAPQSVADLVGADIGVNN